ncbi:hypothetical protein [Henriciella aquimarina]|uniref:hypothetical protein n=1 Tax=Henriciella aquimarina TaxID=545261 RepID=UPI0009FC418D|nr:hypothetical protein [Henriciella aquimarina]
MAGAIISDVPGKLNVAARTLAAGAGGYLLSGSFAVVTKALLPMEPRDAGLLATMLAFIVFTVAVLYAYAVSSARKAMVGIFVPALALFGLVFLVGGGS